MKPSSKPVLPTRSKFKSTVGSIQMHLNLSTEELVTPHVLDHPNRAPIVQDNDVLVLHF